MSAAHHVDQALQLLNRASADWRNGGQCESGPLHWPVAVNLARRELRQALEARQREPDLRELLREAAERLNGWSAGAGPDGKLIARIEAALRPQGKPQERPADGLAGMDWYNGLTRQERREWHQRAGSAVPADAWTAWKASAD